MFKSCPRCGDEFQHWVNECPDCHVPLAHADAGGSAPALGERSAAAPAPFTSPVLLRRGDPRDLRELAERLGAQGIACAVGGDFGKASKGIGRAGAGRSVTLGLFVEERDLPAASEIQRAWLAEQMPEDASAGPVGELSGCPGCGEPLAADARACRSCGLEFPDAELACPSCGQLVAPERESCPHCGVRP